MMKPDYIATLARQREWERQQAQQARSNLLDWILLAEAAVIVITVTLILVRP